MKMEKIGVLGILAVLVVLGMITVGFGNAVSSIEKSSMKDSKSNSWWNEDWQYRRAITITENSGTSLTDYQVKITVAYDSYMNSDFSDLRFTDDSGSLLSYWVEDYTASSSAVVWVNVSSIPANGQATIYMYYGNPTASSASNGDATFEFFDDFDIYDTAKWTSPQPSWATISGGIITVETQSQGVANRLQSQGTYGLNTSAEWYFQFPTFTGATGYDSGIGYCAGTNYLDIRGHFQYSTYIAMYAKSGTTGETALNSRDTAWHRGRISRVSSDTAKIKIDDYSETTTVSSTALPTVAIPLDIMASSYSGCNAIAKVDWVFVRKYASPEPTASIGAEEKRSEPPTVTLISPENNAWQNNRTVDFKFIPTDDIGFTNCSLWTNESGVWALRKVNDTPIINNTVNTIQYTFASDGIYQWNIKCYDNDSTIHSAFASSNRTVKIDTVKPLSSVNILSHYQTTTSFLVSWAGSDDRSVISNYTVYVSDNDSSAFTIWKENTTLTSDTYPSVDGHRYAFYSRARDNAGNFEDPPIGNDTWTVVDITPPTNPTACAESGEAINNTWQNSVSDPAFTWGGEFDSTTGINGFYYYWGSSSTGMSANYTMAVSYDPPAPGEGTYYLRVLTRDDAGNNATTWATLFVFKYDITPPTNPTSCSEFSGVQNNTWQNSVGSPSFSWAGAYDALCGINGYYYYLGKNMYGTSDNYTHTASCTPPAPGEGAFYFRVLAKDNAGNNATAWITMFVFKYDATPPVTNDNAPSGWQTTKPIIVNLTTEADLSGITHTYYKKWLSTEDEPASYTEGTAITLNTEGKWNIKYYSIDIAGNTETAKTNGVWIDTTLPTAVTNVKSVAATENSITLNWGSSTDADFKQYEVSKAKKADFSDAELVTIIADRDTTTYTVTNLSAGTTYYFKIKTVDQAGLSTYSTQIGATTSVPPAELNWLMIAGIIGIIVVIIGVGVGATAAIKKKKGKPEEETPKE